MKLISRWIVLAGVGSVLSAGLAAPILAQTAPAAPAAAAADVKPDYHPSIADLMNIGIAPRHAKIGLALREKNWAYLSYEVNELKNAFNRVVATVPIYDRKTDTKSLVDPTVAQPLASLADAIKAKDIKATNSAYAELTKSCNACHTSVDHAVIVIKAPTASSFPNQDFKPVPVAEK